MKLQPKRTGYLRRPPPALPALPITVDYYHRCASCGDWGRISDAGAAKASCPSCPFVSFRCGKRGCGGRQGVLRSIRAHFSWWAGARGKEAGGLALALAQAVRDAITAWRAAWKAGRS